MWRGEGPVTEGMLHRPIYEVLKRVAREQRTTTYGYIAPLARLDMESPADREKMRELLGKISTYEHQNGRPMLTAVVVHKQDGRPGDGFFELAQHLGLMPRGGDREEFFVRELDRVHQHWKPAGQGGTPEMGRVKEGRWPYLANVADAIGAEGLSRAPAARGQGEIPMPRIYWLLEGERPGERNLAAEKLGVVQGAPGPP